MSKVADIRTMRQRKKQVPAPVVKHEGFQPCSPDMTICGDCADNRAKKKCPRLVEWLARRQER